MATIKQEAATLNADALWLISKVMDKHTGAILEEVQTQIKARELRISTLEETMRTIKAAAAGRNMGGISKLKLLADIEQMTDNALSAKPKS